MERPLGRSSLARGWSLGAFAWALLLACLLQLVLLPSKQVLCQGFLDLNNNNNNQQPAQTQGRRPTNGVGNAQFGPIQQQQQQQQAQFTSVRQFGGQQSASSNLLLPQASFLPLQVAPSQQQQQQQGGHASGQRIVAPVQTSPQRTSSPSSRFVAASSPPSSLAGPQFASSQQQPVVAEPAPGNVEQLMKSALARTAKLEPSIGPESRQDFSGRTLAAADALQSRQGAQLASVQQQQPNIATTEAAQQAPAESKGETAATSAGGPTDADASTGQTATTGSHETVYSEQRFANLFARRKTLNKSHFTPVETTRAKPTLPSFIKSPPDPKQFTAADKEGPIASASSANLLAGRQTGRININAPIVSSGKNLQQQQQQQQQQQKKTTSGAISSSTSLANANKQRGNNSNGKQPITSATANNANQKATNSAKDLKVVQGSSPSLAQVSKPASNNPFSRNNSNANDPANVIAMARKRLLANNALESGRLKQGLSKQANASTN